MVALERHWNRLRESLWFIPGIMLTSALLLALGLVAVDLRIERDFLLEYSLLFGLGADGSRGMLTAIASSMLTVAALSFTLTLNAVAQASSQYSPRVIRNFLDDKSNQLVFGYFVSVFAYCLVVLRTIRGGDEDAFIPSIAVFAGLILALGGVMVLIFFIHHIAVSLQLTNIVAEIVEETRESIDNIYPADLGEPVEEDSELYEEAEKALDGREWIKIHSSSSGYIQSIDQEALADLAKKYKLVAKIPVMVGEFISKGAAIAWTTASASDGSKSGPDEKLESEIEQHFSVNRHQTIRQDIGFGIRQLVDIALKALSTGVNDTKTAVTAIDRLGEVIGQIATRRFPSNVRSANGKAILMVKAPRFEDYVAGAFDEIRASGRGNFAVYLRMIDALAAAIVCARNNGRLRILLRHVELTRQYAAESLETEYEREKVTEYLNMKISEARDQNPAPGN